MTEAANIPLQKSGNKLRAIASSTRDKIRIANRSGIDEVRFRGVYYDSRIGFTIDLRDGDSAAIQDIPFGSYGVVAYRVSDQRALGSLAYPITECQGFALMLIKEDQSDPPIYHLVGEPFLIDCPSRRDNSQCEAE